MCSNLFKQLLSIIQIKFDFDGVNSDENVDYQQAIILFLCVVLEKNEKMILFMWNVNKSLRELYIQ